MLGETVTLTEIGYSELERAIEERYGHEFCYASDEEMNNDSSKTYSFKKEPLASYDQKKLDEWKESGNVNYVARILMQDMVNNDLISEGKVLIKVSW